MMPGRHDRTAAVQSACDAMYMHDVIVSNFLGALVSATHQYLPAQL